MVVFGVILASACTNKKANESQMQPGQEAVEERVRPAASGGTSAAYFSYTNSLNKADTIIAVQADFAGIAQIHESYETEDGMMGMREQKELIVQPGEEIQFKQGGLHVMLMQLNRELAAGDSVTISLRFSQAGEVSKKLRVQP